MRYSVDMSDTPKRPFVSVNISPTARNLLRETTLTLTTPAGRRLSMSAVLIAALQVATHHREEVIALLRESP